MAATGAAASPAAAEDNSIVAIDRASVHRICSGQVITGLATAVKELVENAVDAGATRIAVRLVDKGATLIEVADNGAGVKPADYAALTRKHATSKIASFEDVATVASFGFRGEALSSLCEVASSFTVLTRQSGEAAATLLTFAHDGSLVKQQPAARAVGTTVSVGGLFARLPVRLREFTKGLTRQYSRLLTVLQGYAMILTGVRLVCSNESSAGKGGRAPPAARQTTIATPGSPEVRQNIAAVLGTKFLATLVPFEVVLSGEDGSEGGAARAVGFVSAAGTGVGRSNNDKQFLFINGRPVDVPKVARTLNEAWRAFEMRHKPAYILDLRLPAGTFDVNVNPDKREVFLTEEVTVLANLKEGLLRLWEPTRNTFSVQDQGVLPFAAAEAPARSATAGEAAHDSARPTAAASGNSSVEAVQAESTEEVPGSAGAAEASAVGSDDGTQRASTPAVRAPAVAPREGTARRAPQRMHADVGRAARASSGRLVPAVGLGSRAVKRRRVVDSDDAEASPQRARAVSVTEADACAEPATYAVDISAIRRACLSRRRSAPGAATSAGFSMAAGLRVAAVSDAATQLVEAELSRVLTKDKFRQMRVIGQFNKGFIVTALSGDLFILDQHACDEKVQFESLQRSTTIHQQALLAPRVLELTVAEELVVTEHLSLFERNGFGLTVDAAASPGRRVRLTAVPFSKHVQFGEDDIHELCSLLREDPGLTARLPKLMSEFASRACRSAVMIGTALERDKMVGITASMSALQQPWNCPHGRPTMRHLIDLSKVQREVVSLPKKPVDL